MNFFDTPYLLKMSDLKTISEQSFVHKEHDEDFIISEIIGNVGVIHISGVITEKREAFSRFWEHFGFECSCVTIRNEFTKLMENSSVEAIILNINSGGGETNGVEETSKLIRLGRNEKKVVTLVNSMMLSAAAWIGTSSSEVFIVSQTASTGSIGVVLLHREFSELEKKIGQKTTEITAGEFKRIMSIFKPLDRKGLAYGQGIVDFIYSVFVNEVAINKNITPEKVLPMADGRVFIGQQGIDIGIVDSFSTLNELVEKFQKKERVFMDLAELKEKHPKLYQSVIASGNAQGEKIGLAAGISQGKTQGATEALAGEKKKQERITAIEKLKTQSPGCLATIERMALDNNNSIESITCAVFKEEKSKGTIEAQENNSPEILGNQNTQNKQEKQELWAKAFCDGAKQGLEIETKAIAPLGFESRV